MTSSLLLLIAGILAIYEVMMTALSLIFRKRSRPILAGLKHVANNKTISDEKVLLLGGRLLLTSKHKYLGYIILWGLKRLGLVTPSTSRPFSQAIPNQHMPEEAASIETAQPPITAAEQQEIQEWAQATIQRLRSDETADITQRLDNGDIIR